MADTSSPVLMDAMTLKVINYPGFPLMEKPNTPIVKAMAKNIKVNGQKDPVKIDQHKNVVIGRTRVLACQSLGSKVLAVTLTDAESKAALEQDRVRREWTPVDWARFIEHLVIEEKCERKNVPKYLKENFGLTAGFSTSYVDRYLKLAKVLEGNEAKYAKCVTLNEAVTIMNGDDETVDPVQEKHEVSSDDGRKNPKTIANRSVTALENKLNDLGLKPEIMKQVKEKLKEIRDLLG